MDEGREGDMRRSQSRQTESILSDDQVDGLTGLLQRP